MSYFSEKCKFYLNESESNVYQISKVSGLDRTTIQRMVTGKRLPSPEFVSIFCDHLRINAVERKDLMEAYQIEKIGKSTYMNRKYIKKLIRHIANAQNKPDYYLTLETSSMPADENIYMVLEDAFRLFEFDEILTNIPASHNFFYHALIKLHLQYGKSIPVKHTFSMFPNPLSVPDSNINLQKLYYIIPFLFSTYENYVPSYYYSRNLDYDYLTQLFPYYVITNSSIALFSADFKRSHIINDKKTVQLYRYSFYQIQENTQPLLIKVKTPMEALAYYTRSLAENGFPTHSIEPQPCVFSLLSCTKQLNLLYPANMPGREQLIEGSADHFHNFTKSLGSFKNICSLDAFRALAEDGSLYGAFTQYAEKLPIEERRIMIQQFIKIYKKHQNFYFSDDSFPIPSHLQIELYKTNHMYLISTIDDNFNFLELSESSICEAFYDFTDSLCDDECIYRPEQVLKTLSELAPS